MKIRKIIFMIAMYFCISCTQKHYTNNSPGYHLTKEIPGLVFIEGMAYPWHSNDKGSSISGDSLDIYVGSFYMSKHEITNKDFCYFLNEDSIRKNTTLIKEIIGVGVEQNKIIYEDQKYKPLKGFENYPVVMVSWWGAKKYCEWLTAYVKENNVKSTKYCIADYRLPSEYEWIYAVASTKKDAYDIMPSCNEAEDSSSQSLAHNVKEDSLARSGVTGMNENVYEWTEDNYYKFKQVFDFTMAIGYYYDITSNAVVRKHVYSNDTNCGRISRLRTGFYSNVGFRIVQTHLGRSSGFEF